MGKLVNVVLPGGRVVSVPEDVAKEAQGGGTSHTQSLDEAAASETSAVNEERSSGVGEGVKAGLEGFADAATLGAFGKVMATDADYGRNAQIRAQERPGSRFAGELSTLLLPTGELGLGAKALGEALPANALAHVAGKLGGRLGEGAVYGIGGAIANSNVTGDPLSIEGLVESAGVGAVVNYGIGKLADGLTKASTNATTKLAAAADDAAKQSKLNSLFETNPESYNELVETHRATVDAAIKSQKAYDRNIANYEDALKDFTTKPGNFKNAITDIDVMERKILHQVSGNADKISGGDIGTGIPRTAEITPEIREQLTKFREKLAETRIQSEALFNAGNATEAAKVMSEGLEQAQKIMPGAKFSSGAPIAKLRGEALPSLPRLDVQFRGPRPPDFPVGKLPENLSKFARLNPERIAKLANAVEAGSPLANSIDKFTTDIGMQLGDTAGSTLAGVHAGLQGVSDIVAKEGPKSLGNTLLDTLRKASKRSVAWGTGRTVDRAVGGGFGGAALHGIVGASIGYGLDGVEGAMIGASLLGAKSQSRNTLDKILASKGKAVAGALEAVGPISSYLSTSFPDGKPDTETDVRKLALNRVNEIQATASMATDASFAALQPLMGVPEDIAYKMHMQMVGAITRLNDKLPRDPGLATMMFKSLWKPSAAEAMKLAHDLEVVQAPMKAIQRLISGGGTMEQAHHMWESWPASMQEAASALAANTDTYMNVTREQASALSRVFRVPLTGFAQPQNIAQLQALYLPKPEPASPSPSKAPTGNPTGRPAAVMGPNPNQSRVSQLQRN
jgi:hypothetical protein